MKENKSYNEFEERIEQVQKDSQIYKDEMNQSINSNMYGARRYDNYNPIKSLLSPFFGNKPGLSNSGGRISNNPNGIKNSNGLKLNNSGNHINNSNDRNIRNNNLNRGISNQNSGGTSDLIKGNNGLSNRSIAKNGNAGTISQRKYPKSNLVRSSSKEKNSNMSKSISDVLSKRHTLANRNNLLNKIFPVGNNKEKSKTEDKPSFKDITIKFLSFKAKIIFSVIVACVVITVCVVIFSVMGQVQSMVYGVDSADSITDDSKSTQDSLTDVEGDLSNDHVDNEITD